MKTFDWIKLIEKSVHTLRGKNKSALLNKMIDGLLSSHPNEMRANDAPEKITRALETLLTGSQWRYQPKNRKRWKTGWRGLRLPDRIIYQQQPQIPDTIAWHPFLANKGAASKAKGKFRTTLLALNHYLIECEKLNIDPFGGRTLGQHERSLHAFGHEKKIKSMPREGWKSVPLTREELNCVQKTPPVTQHPCKTGQKPPIIIENIDTFFTFSEFNQTQSIWKTVIWGSGFLVTSQTAEIADITRDAGMDTVLYFGDLDASGLEIVTILRSNLLEHGINLKLADACYRYIIRSALSTDAGGANNSKGFDTRWMPDFIVDNLDYLRAINRRIPQEAFLWE
jgi:Wadjet protein JetD, C-terminal